MMGCVLASLCEGGGPQGRRERTLPLPEILRVVARFSPPPPAGGAPSQRGPRKCLYVFSLISSGFQMTQVTAKATPKEMAIMMRYCKGMCRCSRMPKIPVTPVPVAPRPTMLA